MVRITSGIHSGAYTWGACCSALAHEQYSHSSWIRDCDGIRMCGTAVESVDDTGHGTGLHTLSSLQFNFGDPKISQPIPTLDSMPGAGQTNVELWVEYEADGSHLVFGEQRFGLLLGEAAFRVFEQQLEARFGADLRGVLGANIDCGYAATSVSEQCVLGVLLGTKMIFCSSATLALTNSQSRFTSSFDPSISKPCALALAKPASYNRTLAPSSKTAFGRPKRSLASYASCLLRLRVSSPTSQRFPLALRITLMPRNIGVGRGREPECPFTN